MEKIVKNNEEQTEMLKKITNTFGIDTELCKLSEEIGELLGECYKALYTEQTLEIQHKIEDEFADVMVLMSQIGIYFDLDSNQINNIFDYKVKRTVDRIDEGWYEKHR